MQSCDPQAAADSCERSLKRFPGSANLLCLSAKANIALKNVDIAKSRIEDAMRLFPDFAEAHETLGDLMLIQGRPDVCFGWKSLMKRNSIPSSQLVGEERD